MYCFFYSLKSFNIILDGQGLPAGTSLFASPLPTPRNTLFLNIKPNVANTCNFRWMVSQYGRYYPVPTIILLVLARAAPIQGQAAPPDEPVCHQGM